MKFELEDMMDWFFAGGDRGVNPRTSLAAALVAYSGSPGVKSDRLVSLKQAIQSADKDRLKHAVIEELASLLAEFDLVADILAMVAEKSRGNSN